MTFDKETTLKLLRCRIALLESRNQDGHLWPLIRKCQRKIRNLEAANV